MSSDTQHQDQTQHQSKTNNDQPKRLSRLETAILILVFAIFFCIYMIIPSITINYYNRNNLTSDSDEYVNYILAIVCITIIFICIIGFLVLKFFQISTGWIQIFLGVCAFIHCILSIKCLIQIQIIIDKKFDNNKTIDPNKKIDSSYRFLWICIVVIILLPFFTYHFHHMKSR